MNVAALAMLSTLFPATPLRAATVTLVGSDFDVVYDPSTLGLLGTPQLIGNNLVFTPNAFLAQSLNGSGTTVVNSLASNIELILHPGFQFGALSLVALGDYLMQGSGTAVGVTGSLRATDAAQPLTQTTAGLTVASPLNIANGVAQNWSGSASITDATPTDVPGHNPWLSQAGRIYVQLAGTLTATTTRGSGNSQALIQEKFGAVELMVAPVPVPLAFAAWYLLGGLGVLGALRRKSSRLPTSRRLGTVLPTAHLQPALR